MTTAGRDRCSPPRATLSCIIEALAIAGVSVVTVTGRRYLTDRSRVLPGRVRPTRRRPGLRAGARRTPDRSPDRRNRRSRDGRANLNGRCKRHRAGGASDCVQKHTSSATGPIPGPAWPANVGPGSPTHAGPLLCPHDPAADSPATWPGREVPQGADPARIVGSGGLLARPGAARWRGALVSGRPDPSQPGPALHEADGGLLQRRDRREDLLLTGAIARTSGRTRTDMPVLT